MGEGLGPHGDLLGAMEMMWGQQGQHGDDRDDGDDGDDGDNMGWRQQRSQPWEPHGDLLGAMGTM